MASKQQENEKQLICIPISNNSLETGMHNMLGSSRDFEKPSVN